jgi:N-acetylmuramoyl-L-alanine amidase
MIPYYYFLKVIICSGILLGYYFLVLRNKVYHQYNRFYLLALFIASWIIPLCSIPIGVAKESESIVQQTINVIAITNANFEADFVQPAAIVISWQTIVNYTFWAICTLLFLTMLWRFIKLWIIVYKNSNANNNQIVFSKIEGTPFSFFNYIFWNPAIDITSQDAYQILLHEYEHVKQKHSVDKLIVQLVLIVGWINPIFWIARKELFLIHEFMADKKAVQQGNVKALAKLLLVSSYPTTQHLFTNSFFFSPIKRRLIMITKNTTPQFSHYLQKLIVLPLAAIIIALVAFKKVETPKLYNSLSKQYTIVIDASHGGTDKGAIATDGTTEKEISLQLALAIKAANTNPSLNIVLTRETDVYNNVKEKAALANDFKPDVFISFHANDALKGSKESGFEIYVSSKENEFLKESKLLAQTISNNLPSNIPNLGIKQRAAGIYVLQAVQAPSVLIEAGFLSNSTDVEYIKNKTNQEQLVKQVLLGVEQFLQTTEKNIQTLENEFLQTSNNARIEGATDAEMEIYKNYVQKYFGNSSDLKKASSFGKASENLPKHIKDEMISIYNKMNKQQQAKQTICFMKHPGFLRKQVPTQLQLNNWLKPNVYGIWIDDKRVSNDKLKSYKPSDFSLYTASKLSKNAINYPYHKVQLQLMTNDYYENYVKDAQKQANDYLVMIRWNSKG